MSLARRRTGFDALAWSCLALLLVLCAGMLQAQVEAAAAIQMTTQERLETETWWPTMGTAPLKAYAGSQACLGCHEGHDSGGATSMQQAASPGNPSPLSVGESASFNSGTITYALRQSSAGLELAAERGGQEAAQKVDWVMGAGDLARTFLYQADGHWFQSQASLYTRGRKLDVTTGFGTHEDATLKNTLGNLLTAEEARACFGCHTVRATTSAGLEPLHAEAGVGCEGCHGPGREHISRMSGKKMPGEDLAIFEPGKLKPTELNDFCGACHRSFADANLATGPQADRAVVRFQPYRLEESRCWRATQDERLTCTACHDPHKPLSRLAASYDNKCLNCHDGGKQLTTQHAGALCPKATHDCTSCHMPKVNLPSVHGEFTDHLIRVARVGEPMPR